MSSGSKTMSGGFCRRMACKQAAVRSVVESGRGVPPVDNTLGDHFVLRRHNFIGLAVSFDVAVEVPEL